MKKEKLNTFLAYTAIGSSIATCIATIIAIVSFIASNNQAKKAYDATIKQIELQYEPNIEILPDNMVIGHGGKFLILVVNRGPSIVKDIGITQNEYIGFWKNSEPISITSSHLQTLPSFNKSILQKDSIFRFFIDTKDITALGEQIKKERNCKYIRLVKLYVKFYREVDHKEFIKVKVYLLSEGDCLWDFNDENFLKFGNTSFNEIKRIIMK